LLLLRKQPPTFWSATVRKFKARFDASRTSQSVGNVLPIRPTADRPQKHEVAKQQHKHDGRKSHTTRVTCFEQKKCDATRCVSRHGLFNKTSLCLTLLPAAAPGKAGQPLLRIISVVTKAGCATNRHRGRLMKQLL
jgi:hypothetical protein